MKYLTSTIIFCTLIALTSGCGNKTNATTDTNKEMLKTLKSLKDALATHSAIGETLPKINANIETSSDNLETLRDSLLNTAKQLSQGTSDLALASVSSQSLIEQIKSLSEFITRAKNLDRPHLVRKRISANDLREKSLVKKGNKKQIVKSWFSKRLRDIDHEDELFYIEKLEENDLIAACGGEDYFLTGDAHTLKPGDSIIVKEMDCIVMTTYVWPTYSHHEMVEEGNAYKTYLTSIETLFSPNNKDKGENQVRNLLKFERTFNIELQNFPSSNHVIVRCETTEYLHRFSESDTSKDWPIGKTFDVPAQDGDTETCKVIADSNNPILPRWMNSDD